MMIKKRLSWLFLIIVTLSVTLFLIYSPIVQAQNWTALPPYDTLWPLWSPALSPVDPVTGVPVPIVTELTALTKLPVEPGLTWNPSLNYPWLLYNSPLGMAYFDPIGGVDLWPPPSLIKPNGSIAALELPTDYETLPVTPSSFITDYLPLANPAAIGFLSIFPGAFKGGILPVYLGASALLPPPIIPPPAPIVVVPPPIPVVPDPTVIVPPPTVVVPPPTVIVPPVATTPIIAPTAVVAPPITTTVPADVSGIFFFPPII